MEGIQPNDVLLRFKLYQQKKLELSKLKNKLNQKLIPLQKLNELDESILTNQYTSLSLEKSLVVAQKELKEIQERVVALREEINNRTEHLKNSLNRLIKRKQESGGEKRAIVNLQKEYQIIQKNLNLTRRQMVSKLLQLFPIIKVEKNKQRIGRERGDLSRKNNSTSDIIKKEKKNKNEINPQKKTKTKKKMKNKKKTKKKENEKKKTKKKEKEKGKQETEKDVIEYFILHERLPNPNKKHDRYYKYSKKTALGYVAQFLEILSGILGTKLPFEMSMVGSGHTQIWRKTVKSQEQKSEKRFVLDGENSENSENMGPIAMLNYNIEWLCFSHGWKIEKEDRGNMLKNLYDLVNWGKLFEIDKQASQKLNKDQF
ncbi:uv radiation resistance-associated protein [Anaeramoeba flamelloides]|uniref:Uv radiation resistance-associated protein n=1 Tax=Anaeramoeba flamelloides TaxID=1746091 RepID=A0ABQ8X945_9EUKA|nr:uv radiation resistance-associated protein [Anaeramoeba flamelloides]